MSEHIKIEYSQYDTSLMDSMINEGTFYHRAGRESCPHCKFGGNYDLHLNFFRLPNIVQVIWTPNRFSKRDSALIISHCPKCRKPSWEHVDLNLLHSWAKDSDIDVDPERVSNEKTRRFKQAKLDWESSLCATCKNLEEVPRDWWSYWGSCDCGTASAKKKCDRYVELEDSLELKNFRWDRWMKTQVANFDGVELLIFTCPKCGQGIVSSKGAAKQHAIMEINKIAKIQRRLHDYNFDTRWKMRELQEERRKETRKKLLSGSE